MKIKVFANGLITGLILQLAIGPAFFYVVNLALQRTVFDSLVGAGGVALADYFYITLAIFGAGKLLENRKTKKFFGIASSIVLILFGAMIINSVIGRNVSTDSIISSMNLFSSFSTSFLLTISSPLTIVTVTSLFTTKALEYKYTKHNLIVFGLSMGLSTILFMGISGIIVSSVKVAIPTVAILISNILVGCLLIGYGVVRLFKILKDKTSRSRS